MRESKFDMLIRFNGFNDEAIMRRKGDKNLAWNWAIVRAGPYVIPAPIKPITKDQCELYDFADQPHRVDYDECARVTAVYYLDMLVRFANNWKRISQQLPYFERAMIEPGVRWVSCLTNPEYFTMVAAIKANLSDTGLAVLD